MDFKVPDEKVVKQGFRDTRAMFIISQGSCDVTIFDRSLKTDKMDDLFIRKLDHGEYFGEVSLIFDSVRTATVTCTNYCTLGKLGHPQLYDICAHYPVFRKALVESTFNYDD